MSNGNGSVAATCPVSRSQPKITTQPRGVGVAAVPVAHDLRSVITAINAMSNIVQTVTRGLPQINNTYDTIINFQSTPPEREPPPQYPRITWKEIIRDYTDNEVVNPDDETQRVAIQTIVRVIWQEEFLERRVVYNGRWLPNYNFHKG